MMNTRFDVSDWGCMELRLLKNFLDAWFNSDRPGCTLDVIGFDPFNCEIYAEDANGVFTEADLTPWKTYGEEEEELPEDDIDVYIKTYGEEEEELSEDDIDVFIEADL